MKGLRTYSGRFVLRLPSDLHRRLAVEAEENGRSLNEHCRQLLAGERVGQSPNGIDRELLDLVRRAVEPPPIAVVLFGSSARGRATAASDVDLLLVLEPGVEPSRSLYRKLDAALAEHPFVTRLEPHLVGLPASPREAGGLWHEVALDGLVLWERDARVRELLRGLRLEMARGLVHRHTAHGHPYWVREAS